MIITADGKQWDELQEDLMPTRLIESVKVQNVEGFLKVNPACVSFKTTDWVIFEGNGSFVVFDFGKEICGGLRIVLRGQNKPSKWRVTFGESLAEAYSSIGEKNATNDHSPRDFEFITSKMSDMTVGQTGFRFVRLELLEGDEAVIQNVFAVSHLALFEREAKIVTNDELLNQIIETAIYTLKLCFQNGYIWDGIKRDRLVWSGDLHPEILTSLYIFGDNDNIKNSLTFLRESTTGGAWMNNIPSYSAWWVINLCEYCSFTGNWEFFSENREYALDIIKRLDSCVKEDSTLELTDGFGMEYFLDWSTHAHSNINDDAKAGVASLIRWMAQKFLAIEANEYCERIVDKLSDWVQQDTTRKPARAFQIIAGRKISEADAQMLQEEGARGFSTFMAYYILRAIAQAGGEDMLELMKIYYGGMLSRGATSFWEDFDVDWLEGSGRIDELTQNGQKDIHGSFGKYCYMMFRHSLCHGWSSGVVAFVVEYILGISIKNGKYVSFNPNRMELTDIDAVIPMPNGELTISIHRDEVKINVPEGIELVT